MLETVTNDRVRQVMLEFYAPFISENYRPAERLRAIDFMMKVLRAFFFFEKNKESLLKTEKIWANEAHPIGAKLAVALNELIAAYREKNNLFSEFESAIPVTLTLLANRRAECIERQKAIEPTIWKQPKRPYPAPDYPTPGGADVEDDFIKNKKTPF